MKYFIPPAIFLFTSIGYLFSQQTILVNFETPNDGYSASSTEGSGFTDVFNRTNYDLNNVNNEDGYYWAVEDLNLSNPIITVDQITLSNVSVFNFSIDLTSHHYNDWDESDEVLITYSLDGGAYQDLMSIQSIFDPNSTFNEPVALDTNFDGHGDCGQNTTLNALTTGTGAQGCVVSGSDFRTFSSNNIDVSLASTLDIKLQFIGLTSTDEGLYLDNIKIELINLTTNDCGVSGTYDYGNNEDISNAVGFTSNPGDYVTLDFTAGTTENGYDYWYISDAADGSGNILASGTGSLVGTYTSTTSEISFYVDSDGSWSPAGGGGTAGVTHATFVYSVLCSAPPSCLDPTAFTSSNATSSSVDLAWTAGGSETEWNVDYGAPGFTPGTGTTITSNLYVLTGLSPATTYDVYIQAKCGAGDVSSWVGPISVSTPGSCGTFTLELYDSYGDGWNGGTIDVVVNGSVFIAGATIASGAGPQVYSIPVNIGDVVDFTYTAGSYAGENSYKVFDQNGVEIIHEGAGSSTPNSLSGVSACPSCSDPSGLTASNITTSSADLSWTAGGTETAWNVEYGLTGFVLGSGTLTSTTTGSCIISGLGDNTSYDVYVQADCGSGNVSQWVGPYTFTTTCLTVSTFPFTETFEDASTTRDCWINVQEAGFSDWTYGSGSSGGNIISAYNGVKNAVYVSAFGTRITKLVSPVMDLSSLTAPRVTFYYGQQSWYGDQNETKLYYRTSSSASWVEIWSDASDVSSWIQATVILPYHTSTYQIAFEGINAYGYANVLDNITVEESPLCTDPSGLSASNITTSGADISWTLGGTETAWNVEYGLSGFVLGSGTLTSTTTSSYIISGLGDNTSYDVYVQADCGSGNVSQWVGPFNFTTPIINGCNHSLVMYDSYGDGWNGNTVDVTLNGVTVLSGATIQNGSSASISFSASTGSLITLSNWITGSYTGEVSWEIKDVNGTIIASGVFGELGTAIGNCCPIINGTDVLVACDSMTWIDGVTYTSSNNTATYVLTNTNNCDSVVTLDLTINSTTYGTDVLVACDSMTWIDGVTYTSSNNTATYVLTNTNNCDSVVALDLNLNYSTSSYSTISSCNSYQWNGVQYLSSGLYVDTSINVFGCPNYDTLSLFISNSSTTSYVSSCYDYSWNGNTYDSSGIYLYNNGLCTDTLYLVINETTFSYDTLMVCDSYNFENNNLIESGDYVDTIQNTYGCDSIVFLNLSVIKSTSSNTNLIVCDSLEWNQHIYSVTGIYYDTLLNSFGCDSIDILELSVNYSTFSNEIVNSCNSYTWIDGATYTSSTDSVFFIITNSVGCDSVINLNLTINQSDSIYDIVNACDSLLWNGNTYTTSGLYLDTLQNKKGCDSLVTIDLTLNYSSFVSNSITSCDEYTWIDGITYNSNTDSAIYITTNSAGCDSVITMDLTINNTVFSNDIAEVCDSMEWNGNIYTTSGIYIDTLQTISGCDSIITMDLTINNTVFSNDSAEVCDSIEWNGNVYNASGIYVDTLQTISGCDSIITMGLVVKYTSYKTEFITSCDIAEWNGNVYNASGIYVDTLQTLAGCDSIITMDLTINNTVFSNDSAEVCDGMEWNGSIYTTSGIYIDTLQTISGCDSIITMDLTINNTVFSNDIAEVCDSIEWNGNVYYATGIYTDTLQTISGCDSVVMMDLIVNHTSYNNEFITSCDSIEWNGNIYSTSGIYVDTLLTISGCDSIIIMDLTINNTVFSNDIQQGCDSMEWNGNIYSTSGIYVDTLLTISGCDSIITMDLTINNTVFSNDIAEVCDSIEWNGNVYYATGIYTDTLQTISGCDSVVIMDLIVNHTSYNTEFITSCDSAEWNGNVYNTSGIYVDTLLNISGCDSIITMDLTINNTVFSNDSAEVCDSMEWNGNIYSTSGIYVDTLLTISGCDSIITMDLTINNSLYDTIKVSSCNSYYWDGVYYYSSGFYTNNYISYLGCDSIVILDLIINNASNNISTIYSCDDYNWNGTIYSSSGFHTDTLQSQNGCDSIVTLSLLINNSSIDSINISACDFYQFNGLVYTQSTVLYDSLQTINGCDSVILYNVEIGNSETSSDTIIACDEYIWNGTTYSQSGVYVSTFNNINGCDSVVSLNLTINYTFFGDTLYVNSCDDYLWRGNLYYQSGFYTDTLISSLGCDSIIYLSLLLDNVITSTETISTCDNYFWNGITYSQSGLYIDTLQAVSGCDSVAILNLNITNIQYYNDTIFVCSPYTWNGITYNSSGTYFDTLQTIDGCDSILTLELTVSNNYYSNDSVVNCGSYLWNNNTLINQSGIYTDTLQAVGGCDSILILFLDIIPIYNDTIFATVCDSFNWNGNIFTTSGIYVDTFTTNYGCDSIEVLNLTFNNSSTSPLNLELVLDDYCAETHWSITNLNGMILHSEGPYNCNVNGLGIQANDTINRSLSIYNQGCYKFTLYDYFGDGLGASQWGGTDGSWKLTDYNGTTLTEGQGDFGDSISIEFYIDEDFSTTIYENNLNSDVEIIAYPNPFIEETEINIYNLNSEYSISLYDIQGKVVLTMNNLKKNKLVISSENISRGIYWFTINNHPEIKPLKLVVK